jgi:branched-subunit amino acid ABC-type transport system permease component
MALGLLCATGSACVVGLVSTLLAVRRRTDPLAAVLASFGFAIVLESLVLTVLGKDPFIRQPFSTFWNIFGVRISPQAGINLAVGLVILVFVFMLLYRTPWGRAMRASSVNPRGAALAGIPVRLAQFSAFVMAGLLAGVAGILTLYTSGMSFSSGLYLTLTSLGAAILLGLHSPLRGFVGGIGIGIVEALSIGLAPQGLGTVLPYLFIFAALCTGRMNRAGIEGGRA